MLRTLRLVFNSDIQSKYLNLALLIMRVAFGLMIALGHGWCKLCTFAEKSATFSDPLGVGNAVSLSLAVFAEFFCGLSLALGFVTRAVAFPLFFAMIVAVLIVHSNDPWSKKELALTYAIPFLTLMIAGGGKYSLDQLITSRFGRTPQKAD